MLVYVLKQNGQPFMPTERFGKVRRLLKEGKAKVVRREPFTIRLLYEPETDVVQECYCGVDTGSKHIGVAVIGNDKVLYQSQIELRNDIKKKIDRRRTFRRNRRSRKTRYRKCRFLNRRNSIKKDRLPPSVRHKIQAHIDEILVGHELEDFSLTDIKMLSQILKHKVVYLDKMFERRLLHIIEVTRELDFSDCGDLNISWHIVGQDVIVSVLIHQLPNDYVISAKMLNMSDEDLIENKELCKYIG